jgi:hypothetical protein
METDLSWKNSSKSMTRETTPFIATRLLPGPRTLLRDLELSCPQVRVEMLLVVTMERVKPPFQTCKI